MGQKDSGSLKDIGQNLIEQGRKLIAYSSGSKLQALSYTQKDTNEFIWLAKEFYKSKYHPFRNDLIRAANIILVSFLGCAFTKLNNCLPSRKYIDLLRDLFRCSVNELEDYDAAIAELVSEIIDHPSFKCLSCIERSDVFIFVPWLPLIYEIIPPRPTNFNRNRLLDRTERFNEALKYEVEKHIPCKRHRIRLGLDGKDYPVGSLVTEDNIQEIAFYRWLSERGVRGNNFVLIFQDTFPGRPIQDRLLRNLKHMSELAEEQGIQIDEDDLPPDLEKIYNKVMKRNGHQNIF